MCVCVCVCVCVRERGGGVVVSVDIPEYMESPPVNPYWFSNDYYYCLLSTLRGQISVFSRLLVLQ